eukprot:gene8807-4859_t
MESDEDNGAFGPISRSWDDIEGARSILNLNSPNGFHPSAAAPPGGAMPSASFLLPAASAPVTAVDFNPAASLGSIMNAPAAATANSTPTPPPPQ